MCYTRNARSSRIVCMQIIEISRHTYATRALEAYRTPGRRVPYCFRAKHADDVLVSLGRVVYICKILHRAGTNNPRGENGTASQCRLFIALRHRAGWALQTRAQPLPHFPVPRTRTPNASLARFMLVTQKQLSAQTN